MWTQEQIQLHTTAAKRLGQIKDAVVQLFRDSQNISEYDAQQAILDFFKVYNLKLDSAAPIVAFRENTSHVHYFPEQKIAKQLKKNSLILVDIWARMNERGAPYADMTWMFYYGDIVDPAFVEGFSYVAKARDKAIAFIQKEVAEGVFPLGRTVDALSRDYLERQGVGKYFGHSLGHALGMVSPHANYGGPSRKSKQPLRTNLGYTIEPGIYFPKKYGFRTEIDLYITDAGKVVITTPVQKEIECI
jgi:Xaa-Pro aminopeptidase